MLPALHHDSWRSVPGKRGPGSRRGRALAPPDLDHLRLSSLGPSSPLPQPKSAVADCGHFVWSPNSRCSEVRLRKGRGWGWRSEAPSCSTSSTPYLDPPPQAERETRKPSRPIALPYVARPFHAPTGRDAAPLCGAADRCHCHRGRVPSEWLRLLLQGNPRPPGSRPPPCRP